MLKLTELASGPNLSDKKGKGIVFHVRVSNDSSTTKGNEVYNGFKSQKNGSAVRYEDAVLRQR